MLQAEGKWYWTETVTSEIKKEQQNGKYLGIYKKLHFGLYISYMREREEKDFNIEYRIVT